MKRAVNDYNKKVVYQSSPFLNLWKKEESNWRGSDSCCEFFKRRRVTPNIKRVLLVWFCNTCLLPRSFLYVPPYFGLVPIRSMISGMQEANKAWREMAKIMVNHKIKSSSSQEFSQIVNGFALVFTFLFKNNSDFFLIFDYYWEYCEWLTICWCNG